MSIFDARPNIAVDYHSEVNSSQTVYEKTLKAVKRRRGLIHGHLNQKGRVCALGALCASENGMVIAEETAEEIQQFNDSMPDVTPQERRLKVIEFLEGKLKELTTA